MKSLDHKREQMLLQFQEVFKIQLAFQPYASAYRDDVSKHCFIPVFDPPNEKAKIDNAFRAKARKWLEDRGWQFARQVVKSKIATVEYIYIGERFDYEITDGYHATTYRRWNRIEQEGLRPCIPELQMSLNRCDTEGNIYVCGLLGGPADAGVPQSMTAHWWRCHLCQESDEEKELSEWVILHVTLSGIPTYADMFSKSGFVIDSGPIPPERLRLAYSEH